MVCIAEATHRPGINEIGDVVSVHEDDVDLSGIGYLTFNVIYIENMTAAEIISNMEALPDAD
jgi:hypothetical protein